MGHLDAMLRGVAPGHAVLADGDGRLRGVVPLPEPGAKLDAPMTMAGDAAWLRKELKRTGMTRKSVAARLEVSPSRLSEWSLCREPIPTARMRQLEAVFDSSARFVLRFEGDQ
jgi:plasmid maintenance system antidote protein VapI